MDVKAFIETLGVSYATGVPDSKLRALVDYLVERHGVLGTAHVIAANEGAAVGLAAGYHIATGKVPLIYLQNSGLGNTVNPLLSLLHEEVYAVPAIFVVGWRGEPSIHDEPQHIVQGRLTLPLLETMGVETFVLTRETTAEELVAWRHTMDAHLAVGRQCAVLVREGALSHGAYRYANAYALRREDVIARVLDAMEDAIFVATTGKAGRELFDLREIRKEHHAQDFLTVGSMGHASAIALGMAMQRPNKRIVCLDGDGAALMHMGSMATIAAAAPKNLIHMLLNNEAHESVGGAPSAARRADFPQTARALGYPEVYTADSEETLSFALAKVKASDVLTFLEVRTAIGSRKDLGRPTTTPKENKEALMRTLHR